MKIPEKWYRVFWVIALILLGIEIGFILGCTFQQYLYNNPIIIVLEKAAPTYSA